MPWTKERLLSQFKWLLHVLVLSESHEARGYVFSHTKWHLFVHKTSSIRWISLDDPIRSNAANTLRATVLRCLPRHAGNIRKWNGSGQRAPWERGHWLFESSWKLCLKPWKVTRWTVPTHLKGGCYCLIQNVAVEWPDLILQVMLQIAVPMKNPPIVMQC